MENGLLDDVIGSKSAAVLKLLAGEDEALLVGRDALLVLDLGLDILNGVRGLDLKSYSLTSQSLDEDLHVVDGLRKQDYACGDCQELEGGLSVDGCHR